MLCQTLFRIHESLYLVSKLKYLLFIHVLQAPSQHKKVSLHILTSVPTDLNDQLCGLLDLEFCPMPPLFLTIKEYLTVNLIGHSIGSLNVVSACLVFEEGTCTGKLRTEGRGMQVG